MADSGCPHAEQAAAYVMELLQGAEWAHFHAHLDECPACRLAVQELSGVAELLDYAPVPVAPPPDLKARIMAQVAATAQDVPPTRVAAAVQPPAAGAQAPRPPGTVASRLPAWAAAAMVAMALGLAGLGWQISRMSVELSDLHLVHELLVRADRQVTGRQITLVGTEAAPEAEGVVILIPAYEGVQVVLRATGLQPLSGPQAYHLWMLKDGQRQSAGAFVVDPQGWAAHTHWFARADDWDAVGVTLEPDPEPRPRGQKVLGGNI